MKDCKMIKARLQELHCTLVNAAFGTFGEENLSPEQALKQTATYVIKGIGHSRERLECGYETEDSHKVRALCQVGLEILVKIEEKSTNIQQGKITHKRYHDYLRSLNEFDKDVNAVDRLLERYSD